MPFPLDIKWIREAEEKLEAKLPLSYVDFLSKSNGGEVVTQFSDWQLYPVWDKTNRKTLARTCNDIVAETKLAKEWSNFPENAIAIGSSGYGDRLVFMKSDETVYAWNHETGELIIQASSFAEIVGGDGN